MHKIGLTKNFKNDIKVIVGYIKANVFLLLKNLGVQIKFNKKRSKLVLVSPNRGKPVCPFFPPFPNVHVISLL